MDNRIGDMQAPVTGQPQLERQGDVLEVAELRFLETADFLERLPVIECSCA